MIKNNSPFTSYFSRSASREGMTLIEIMVSLVILMVILGAIFSILNMQQSKAVNVQATSVLQTDAQVALTLFRWDLFMVGYGIGQDDQSITSTNSSSTADQITLRGMGLGFESDYVDWSPVLDEASNVNAVKVYRFSDSMPDFHIGDTIMIVDPDWQIIDSNLAITDIDTITHSSEVDTLPGLRVEVNRNVSVSRGAVVFRPNKESYTGISYTISNRKMMRGNEVFLENVEDIQFAYGVDLNNNGTFENGEWFNDLNAIPGFIPRMLYEHKTAIRATFVVLSERGISGYTYPTDTITVEDHTYSLSTLDKSFKREIVTAISQPRNLQK